MKKFKFKINADILKTKIQGKFNIVNNIEFDNVAELAEADENSICFIENPKFLKLAENSKAGLLISTPDFKFEDRNVIYTPKPYFMFMFMVREWLKLEESVSKPVIHTSAVVAEEVKLGNNVSLGAHVFVAKGAEIGNNTRIEANCSIGENVKIGDNCHFYPNVNIYHDCAVGNKVILHSGVVIGADGFGYIEWEKKQEKIPQVGNVVLEDDVEIGANSCVDRATLGTTRISRGTKIDNLVQIGHNCTIGNDTIVCAQVGLAGSTNVGNNVYLAGQVGAGGHLNIGDNVLVGAQSGIAGNLESNMKYFGTPAIDAMQQKRVIVAMKRLPEIVKKMKKIKS